MTGCVPIRKLNGQKLKGAIVCLFREQNTGIIRGDDGYDAGFHAVSVAGTAYKDLFAGERVTYQLSFSKSGKVSTAINVQPDRSCEPQPDEKPATLDSPR
jgi:cold shock CspA family protein